MVLDKTVGGHPPDPHRGSSTTPVIGRPAAHVNEYPDQRRQNRPVDAVRNLLDLLFRVCACVAGMRSDLVDGYDSISACHKGTPLAGARASARHASRHQSDCSDGINRSAMPMRCPHTTRCALPAQRCSMIKNTR